MFPPGPAVEDHGGLSPGPGEGGVEGLQALLGRGQDKGLLGGHPLAALGGPGVVELERLPPRPRRLVVSEARLVVSEALSQDHLSNQKHRPIPFGHRSRVTGFGCELAALLRAVSHVPLDRLDPSGPYVIMS